MSVLLFFLLFFSCCSYSSIYVNLFYKLLFKFSIFSLFSILFFFLLSFLLIIFFFPLFFHHICLIFVFFTLFPSWHSALNQISGLNFTYLCFNWSLSFFVALVNKSVSCTFFCLEYFCYICVCKSVYICPIVSVNYLSDLAFIFVRVCFCFL